MVPQNIPENPIDELALNRFTNIIAVILDFEGYIYLQDYQDLLHVFHRLLHVLHRVLVSGGNEGVSEFYVLAFITGLPSLSMASHLQSSFYSKSSLSKAT